MNTNMSLFRKEYRELSDEEKAKLEALKTKAEELLEMFGRNEDGHYSSREMSLAATKLEECVMWAVKGITA